MIDISSRGRNNRGEITARKVGLGQFILLAVHYSAKCCNCLYTALSQVREAALRREVEQLQLAMISLQTARAPGRRCSVQLIVQYAVHFAV